MNIFKKIRFTLKAKFLIMTLVLVLAGILCIGIMCSNMATQSLTSAVDTTLKEVALNTSNQLKDMNDREFTMLKALARIEIFQDPEVDLKAKCDYLTAIVSMNPSKYENIGYTAIDGMSYLRSGELRDLSKASYFDTCAAGKDFLKEPYVGVTGELFMLYGVPVYTNGKVSGMITSVIKGNALADVVSTMTIGKESHPQIISRTDGSTISTLEKNRSNIEDLDHNLGLYKVLKAAQHGETGQTTFIDPFTNVKMAVSYMPIPDCNWAVFCAAPYSDFFSALDVMHIKMMIYTIVCVIVAVLVSVLLVIVLLKPLGSVKDAILEIASGNADLTNRLSASNNDEIGDVVNGFNKFTEKLQVIMSGLKDSKNTLTLADDDLKASTEDTSASITEILANIEAVHQQIDVQSSSVHETAGAVNQIASNIESLERMIESQSAGVVQASAAVEEMIGNISSVNNSMDKMSVSFDELTAKAQNGAQLQSGVNEKIEQIKIQSETLQEANQAIAAIAKQTNLLAMNAAIEAAHAGSAGKGFSVVADEIRKLSETSSAQSKSIGDELNSIRKSIESMVDASRQSSTAFQSVTDKIRETDELVRQTKAAMEEQTQGSQQISEALHSMNDSTSEVKVASKEMAEGNKQILEEVRNLQDATGVMKNSMEEMSVGATKINETGVALTEISRKMSDSINEISKQVDQFKV